MPKRSRTGKPDVNQMAANLIGAISGDLPDEQESGKNPAAVALGRRRGVKAGIARAAKLSKHYRVRSCYRVFRLRVLQSRTIVKIEFLILADSAQVADGKLFLLGGGWSLHRSGNFPSQIQFAIGLSVLVPWNEAGIRYPSTLTIADDAGVPIVPPLNGQIEVGKSDQIPNGMTQRALFAVNFNIALPRPGRYVVSATAGSSKTETIFEAMFVGKKVDFTPETGPLERGN